MFVAPDVGRDTIELVAGKNYQDMPGVCRVHENVPVDQMDAMARDVCSNNFRCLRKYYKIYMDRGRPVADMVNLKNGESNSIDLQCILDLEVETFNEKLSPEQCLQMYKSGTIPPRIWDDEDDESSDEIY
ncbi:hypothetical protein GGH92_000032 [Coemansia sp. RSA 2673]|nr:hypothetical protein GGH92_000032 [Coemansia sp. RSA 2673]